MTFMYGPSQPTVTPVVQLAKPTGEIGVADVLVSIVSLIGVLIVVAALVGLATGGLFILYRRWRDGKTTESPLASYTRLGLSAADREPGAAAAAGSTLSSASASAASTSTATPRS
jgi:hypothetical protein